MAEIDDIWAERYHSRRCHCTGPLCGEHSFPNRGGFAHRLEDSDGRPSEGRVCSRPCCRATRSPQLMPKHAGEVDLIGCTDCPPGYESPRVVWSAEGRSARNWTEDVELPSFVQRQHPLFIAEDVSYGSSMEASFRIRHPTGSGVQFPYMAMRRPTPQESPFLLIIDDRAERHRGHTSIFSTEVEISISKLHRDDGLRVAQRQVIHLHVMAADTKPMP